MCSPPSHARAISLTRGEEIIITSVFKTGLKMFSYTGEKERGQSKGAHEAKRGEYGCPRGGGGWGRGDWVN